MRFITTHNGVRLLMKNNYTFNTNVRKKDGGTRYKCSKSSCRASIHLDANEVVVGGSYEHNHEPRKFYSSSTGVVFI